MTEFSFRTDLPAAGEAPVVRGHRSPSSSRTEGRRETGPGDHRPVARALRLVWVLAVGAVVGAVLGLASLVLAPLEVTASENLVVTSGLVPAPGESGASPVTERDVQSHVEILAGGAVLRRAEDATGGDLPTLSTTSSNTSDVIGASVSAADGEEASAALDGYVDAFLTVVSEGQRATLTGRSTELDAQLDVTSKDLQGLDAAVQAVNPQDRGTLVAQQQAARTALVARQQQASQDASDVRQALDGLPISVEPVDREGPVLSPPSVSTMQRVLLGALLGLAAAAVVVYRAAFRP